MGSITINLLSYKQIKLWTPKLGDKILYNGWFIKWIGVINGVTGSTVSIVKAGSIIELAMYTQKQINSSTINIDIDNIMSSGGKYEVLAVETGSDVWYV